MAVNFKNKSIEQLCLNHGSFITVKKDTIFFDEYSYLNKSYVYYLVDGICSISGHRHLT